MSCGDCKVTEDEQPLSAHPFVQLGHSSPHKLNFQHSKTSFPSKLADMVVNLRLSCHQ